MLESFLHELLDAYFDYIYGRYHLMRPRSGTNTVEMTAWCVDQFGQAGPSARLIRRYRWLDAGGDVYIRDADDAFSFKIRWC